MKAYHWKTIKRGLLDNVVDPDLIEQQSIEWLTSQAHRSYGPIEGIEVIRHEVEGSPVDEATVPFTALSWSEVGDVVILVVTTHHNTVDL